MTEKGKRLATREDIEHVLSEVRAVTKETETIKAQIGSDLWLRQTVWGHKREAYVNILKCSHHLQDALSSLRSTRMTLQILKEQATPAEHLVDMESNIAKNCGEYTEAQGRLLDALTETEIFVDGIPELRMEYVGNPLLKIAFDPASDPDESFQLLLGINQWTRRIVELGRNDLGFTVKE